MGILFLSDLKLHSLFSALRPLLKSVIFSLQALFILINLISDNCLSVSVNWMHLTDMGALFTWILGEKRFDCVVSSYWYFCVGQIYIHRTRCLDIWTTVLHAAVPCSLYILAGNELNEDK